MPNDNEIHLQALRQIDDLVGRMPEREMPLRVQAALGQPVDTFLKDVARGVFETAARHIG